MKLSLLLHAHQPPGNFHHIFELALKTCYGPVLDLLEERPAVRVSMHWSGPLLEWFAEHAPERIRQLRLLVEREQVELVAAGMYEPVLALLPKWDRLGQLRAHQAYLEELFGRASDVGWLTERVWEPEIAADLVDGGIRIVTLDDQHLLSAGTDPEGMYAPYLTEAQGRVLRVAPVPGDIRQAIPWQSVDEAIALIRRRAREGHEMLVYGDDTEKFGLWPGTYEDVIQSGWLAQFFDRAAALEGVEFVPVGEAVATTAPAGRTYIPDGSYPEMLEWSLPPGAQRRLARARQRIPARDPGGIRPFMRAGQFRLYLAKYPEVNHLHKRMLDVSQRIQEAFETVPAAEGDPDLVAARRSLWRAQANCVYWHGLFGGIYLPHLRHTAWESLLTAERSLAQSQAGPAEPRRVFDLDADGEDEVVLTTPEFVVVVDPADGAAVEVSHLPSAVNLVDTLARRPEVYHEEDAPASNYDRGRRAWFVDRFVPAARPTGVSEVEEIGAFAGAPYVLDTVADDEVTLRREGDVGDASARVEKTIRIEGSSAIEAQYRVEATEGGSEQIRFGVSIDLGLLYRHKPSGRARIGGRTRRLPAGGSGRNVERVEVAMDGVPVVVVIEAEPGADVDIGPIATESRSEAGFEHLEQSLAVLLSWPIELSAGASAFEPRIRVTIESAEAGAGAGDG